MLEVAGAALVPIQQHQVSFYGDPITGVLIEQAGHPAEWYVPLRPIAEFLGLVWTGQRVRTVNDEVLGESLISVKIIFTEIPGQDQGTRTMWCLPLRYLPGWLFGLYARKVKPELAAKIRLYRRECFDILWRAFQPEILPAPPLRPANP